MGVLHHNLKPSNVVFVPDAARPSGERVVVTDFGFAPLVAGGLARAAPANVAPEQCSQFFNDALSGQWQGALYGQVRLIRLHKALFADASPSPTKFALAHLGLCAEDARLPIVPCSDAARTEVLAAMRDAGVI